MTNFINRFTFLGLLALAPWSLTAQKLTAKNAPPRLFAVYRPDGTRQCVKGKPVPLATMTKELKSLGATVLFADARQLPMAVPTECGAPTGTANYFEITVNDSALFHHQPASGAFTFWPFEQATRVVYRSDRAVLCRVRGISIDSTAQFLTKAGVPFLTKMIVPLTNSSRACGSSEGDTHLFRIAATDLASAIQAGFKEFASRLTAECLNVVAPASADPMAQLLSVPEVLGVEGWRPPRSAFTELGNRTLVMTKQIRRNGSVGDVTFDLQLSDKSKKDFLEAAKFEIYKPAVFDGCFVDFTAEQKLTFNQVQRP